MKKTISFVITAAAIIGAFVFAVYWMDRNSYVNKPDLPVIDPTSVGASARQTEVPRGEGPILIDEGMPQAENTGRTPVPIFWMAVGAVCAGTGVLIATRGGKTSGKVYSMKGYR